MVVLVTLKKQIYILLGLTLYPTCFNEGAKVSKENVVLRRWESDGCQFTLSTQLIILNYPLSMKHLQE